MANPPIGSELLKVRLYVAGGLPSSARALRNVRDICARHFDSNVQTEIVDVLREPLRAAQDGILFTPTLMRLNPEPQRFIAGDLSSEAAVLKVLTTRNSTPNRRQATAPVLPRLAGRCTAAVDALRRTGEEIDALVDAAGQVFLLANGQEALREREEKLRSLLDAAPDCIITLDEESRIEQFNPAAERVFGYKRDEVIGRHISDTLLPAAKHDAHARRLARFIQTGKSPLLDRYLQLTGRHADGSQFRMEVTIARLSSSPHPCFGLFIRDLRRRRKRRRSVHERGQ